ncbi:hypothetical protein [Halomonas sp. OfavH-34-E]|uniref:hypothetical protein n=1 Tax=Halomonas sp. OfavH-34-E TaxID=2954491 RepID=UPI002097F9EC|nr:hypothetical protein [Halomonas sp. OfavH-34-E]MCO7214140.1 hypothetical protein [Halomonas sp. OfavH-34-E]
METAVTWIYFVGVAAFLFWIWGLLSGPSATQMEIAPDDLSGAWPLTVDEVQAYCPGGVMAAVEVNGKRYGINGPASTYGEQHGWPPIEDIWKQGDLVPRVSISELISVVRDRCVDA